MTPGLENCMSIKKQFLSKFIKLKDLCQKKEANIRYKQYQNLIKKK